MPLSRQASTTTGLEGLQQKIRLTHLRGDAFGRLLANRAIEVSRLEALLKVIVWEVLAFEGIDADAAILVRAGEPGYGWTNGGWLLAKLEPELRELFARARLNDGAFARKLARAMGQVTAV